MTVVIYITLLLSTHCRSGTGADPDSHAMPEENDWVELVVGGGVGADADSNASGWRVGT
jgi:hypothetical protein